MSVTPAGRLTEPFALLRAQLAQCATFRNLNGLGMSIPEAEARIHYLGLPPPAGDDYTAAELGDGDGTGYRPFALIYRRPNEGIRTTLHDISGSTWGYLDRGILILTIEKYPTAIEATKLLPTRDAEMTFEVETGKIIDELLANAGQEGYLAIEEMGVLLGPYSCGEDDAPGEHGPWQMVHLEITYKAVDE